MMIGIDDKIFINTEQIEYINLNEIISKIVMVSGKEFIVDSEKAEEILKIMAGAEYAYSA